MQQPPPQQVSRDYGQGDQQGQRSPPVQPGQDDGRGEARAPKPHHLPADPPDALDQQPHSDEHRSDRRQGLQNLRQSLPGAEYDHDGKRKRYPHIRLATTTRTWDGCAGRSRGWTPPSSTSRRRVNERSRPAGDHWGACLRNAPSS